MTGSAESTIDYYHQRKEALMRAIIRENMPVVLPDDFEPFCQNCKIGRSEAEQLHIEHPNGDSNQQRDEKGEKPGGWQNLYRYEEHFEEDKTLWVVCDVCHYLLHKVRDDGHAKKLMRGRPYIEQYEDKDPAFELKKRSREGGSIYGEV